MSGYRERDAARDTDTSERDATATWHQARDDARARSARPDDRPTRQNREDSRRLERKYGLDRGSDRPRERGEDRPER